MKDLQSLASAAARITAANPEIAEQHATPEISQPVQSANRNPNMRLNPEIEHLRRVLARRESEGHGRTNLPSAI